MSIWSDVRLAMRALLRERSFTLTALFALALGIAANATVFTILNGIFIRDLPFAEPDRIVGIETRRIVDQTSQLANVSYADLQDLRSTARLFDGIAGVDPTTMNVSDEEHAAERYSGAYISAHGFELLGHRPALGRGFRADDERPGAEPVAILGHDIWEGRYRSDPAIVGRVVRVNGVAATVVGVMPPGFAFPQVAALWMPLTHSTDPAMQQRDARNIEAFGRRRIGVTNEQAQTDLDSVFEGLARIYPETNSGTAAVVMPYRDTMIGGPLPGIFATLAGAVALLLLIACANVANLQLARGVNRRRDVALRLSLGSSRVQIIRQMLIESLVLAAAAGAIGLLLAAAGTRLFVNGVVGTNPPYFLQFPLEPRVIGFVVMICIATAVVFGLAPALHAARVSLSSILNEAGHAATGGPRTRWWAGSLVVVQLTLGIVLLAGASALVSTVVARVVLDPGIETDDIIVAQLELPSAGYATAESRRLFYERLDARLGALPGIRAAMAAWAPTAGGGSMRVAVEGSPAIVTPEAQPRTTVVPVGARYFETVGIRTTRGRTFADDDVRRGQLLAVVNEQFARVHFPGRQPLGARIRVSPRRGPDAVDWLTIVGVVPNVRQEEADPRQIEPVVYTPTGSDPLPFAAILARSNQDLATVTATLRREVATIDRDLPLFGTGFLSDVVDGEFLLMRVIVSMLAVFAVAAVSLAAIGLYAITSYATSRRTREIGVRVAFGARAADVGWLVTRRAAAQLGVGLLLGLVGAVAVGIVLEAVFETVDGHDPLVLATVALLMIVVGCVAAWAPTARAVRLNPVDALRTE